MNIRRSILPARITLLMTVIAVSASAEPSTLETSNQGVIIGRVVAEPDSMPGSFATVVVLGTRRGAQAGEEGTFRITGVPVGAQTLRIMWPGYSSGMFPVDVSSGETQLGDLVLKGGLKIVEKSLCIEPIPSAWWRPAGEIRHDHRQGVERTFLGRWIDSDLRSKIFRKPGRYAMMYR